MLGNTCRSKLANVMAVAAWLAASVACNTSSPVSRDLGARCADQDECSEICLAGQDFPDGFCSQSCDNTDDCSSNAVCVDIDQGVCLLPCEVEEDCTFLGPGWMCSTKRPEPGRRGDEVRVCAGT